MKILAKCLIKSFYNAISVDSETDVLINILNKAIQDTRHFNKIYYLKYKLFKQSKKNTNDILLK